MPRNLLSATTFAIFLASLALIPSVVDARSSGNDLAIAPCNSLQAPLTFGSGSTAHVTCIPLCSSTSCAPGFYCDSGTGLCTPGGQSSSGGVSVPGGINPFYLKGYAGGVIYLINIALVPVLIAIAFFYFIIGIYKYFFLGANNDVARAEGRQFVLWSVVGFVAIFSLWGLVALATNTFSIAPGGAAPPYPTL